MDDTDNKQMLAFFDELQQEPSTELKQAMAVLVTASGERLEKKLAAQLGIEVHDIRLSPVDPADLKGLIRTAATRKRRGKNEMKTFYVLLLRSIGLLGSQGFDTVQHLQYIAGPIQATDENAAAESAQAELVAADRKDKVPKKKDTVVLGVIEDGIYRPWLNGRFR